MSSGEKKPPIIKKIIKKGHGGHHGGSWKVAYADFVTALMAFFLVMWLLAISSEAGKAAMAEYFQELTMEDAVFNGGLLMTDTQSGAKGPGIMEGGCMQLQSQGKLKALMEPSEELSAFITAAKKAMEDLASLPEGTVGGEGAGDMGRAEREAREELAAKQNVEKQQASAALQESLRAELGGDLGSNILVEPAPGGLRVQLIDADGRPIFETGGVKFTPVGKQILMAVGERLNSVPNKISIEGHTDATVPTNQQRTNWELSTMRAASARIMLATESKIPDERIKMVAGFAATQPLDQNNPKDPINRRVSIMIWDDEAQPGQGIESLRPGQSAPPQKTEPQAQPPASEENKAATPTAATPTNVDQQTLPQLEKPNRPPNKARPKRPAAPDTSTMTREEIEQMLINETLEQSAKPDLSTVGPSLTKPADADSGF